MPSRRRATNSSSAWLIGQRRSSSEWMISIGQAMSRTRRIGDIRVLVGVVDHGRAVLDPETAGDVGRLLLGEHVVDRPLEQIAWNRSLNRPASVVAM